VSTPPPSDGELPDPSRSPDPPESPHGPPPVAPFAALKAAKAPASAGPPGPESEPADSPQTSRDEPDVAPIAETRVAAAAPESPSGDSPDIDGPPLKDATLEYWLSLTEDERIACHETIDNYYHNLLEDFRGNANDAVTSYGTYETRNKHWRLTLICMTGGLALLNVAATSLPEGWRWGTPLRLLFSFAAAIYAVILALLTNIESYLHYNDKRMTTRESRELYLDAYREFEMLRLLYVYPFGYDAQACYNFNTLYQRLVTKDLELRRKIMNVGTTRTGMGKE
jgi:hypothetical protein